MAYLTVILYLSDRKLVNWAMSNNLGTRNTVISDWRMAIKSKEIKEELIFHSDQGIQCACTALTNKLIRYHGLVKQRSCRKVNLGIMR